MDTTYPGRTPVGRQDRGIAVLRAVVGLTFMMHGWQKLFDMGIPGVTGFFGQLGVPAPAMAATAVSLLEFAGGAALIVGLFTRWVSIPLALDVLVATLLVHLPNGFFAPMGYELTLLLLGGSVVLILAGPGALALDNVIVRRGRSAAPVGRMRDTVGAARRD